MKNFLTVKNLLVVATFVLVACVDLGISYSAPYIHSGDALVYLTGALQVQTGALPDAYMLQGMDFRPYYYPQLLLWGDQTVGYERFREIFLVVVVITTGLAAYAMFRLMLLPFVPALLMAVVAIMPRFASGLEIFGVFTLRDSIGRSSAYPLFFLATGFLVRRFMEGKSLWPIFGICGILVFLHPVTVMLFAAVSLVVLLVARLVETKRVLQSLGEVVLSGLIFMLGGAYFFVEVFTRLSRGIAAGGVDTTRYVEALLMRNQFDFPNASMDWYPHMAIVSGLFCVIIIATYTVPALRKHLRTRHPAEKLLLLWGGAMAVSALSLGILLPGLNLYAMEHFDAPYIFQQWSRIAKFYYLGVFVALVPAAYALWGWYTVSTARFKKLILVVLTVGGIMSSTPFFEAAQFTVGYKNFDKAYVPQVFSGVADDITPAEYREACKALVRLGVDPTATVISGDFAFRYFCRADLYVTSEEGSAYQQLPRADLLSWYDRYLSQRDAFKNKDRGEILAFAKSVGAQAIIVAHTPVYEEVFKNDEVITTARHLVVRVH